MRIRPPQPFQCLSVHWNRRSIPMASILREIAVGDGKYRLADTSSGYFVRYRLALYLLSAAAVAVGFALNWNWLTAAGLFRVVAVLPCALMMFRCVRRI